MSRRELIADTGIRLIARQGMRRLTHLVIDAEAGLPKGSTSYYARTRRDLLELVVRRLSDGSAADVEGLEIPSRLTPSAAARIAVEVLERMAAREDAQAARFALMFELRNDEELRRLLTEDAPVRQLLHDAAARILRAVGLKDAEREAPNLVALVDALLMYRAARAAEVDAEGVLGAYFRGVSADS